MRKSNSLVMTLFKLLKTDKEVMQITTDAFLKESGGALIKKYKNLGDAFFTEAGYSAFAEDLLERMTNPYPDDTGINNENEINRYNGNNAIDSFICDWRG